MVELVGGVLLLLEHASNIREVGRPREGGVRRFSFQFDSGIDRGSGTAEVRDGKVERVELCASPNPGRTCLDTRLRFRGVDKIEAPPSTAVVAGP